MCGHQYLNWVREYPATLWLGSIKTKNVLTPIYIKDMTEFNLIKYLSVQKSMSD